MPDNHVNFVYKLDGEVSEIDVFKLAPTLLALGELIQESNKLLNPSGKQIGVNVKPFRPGSFIVDLTVFPQNNLQQFLDLLNAHPVEQVKTLLEWIGLIGGGPVGVVQLVKWLKGRPKSVQEIQPGEYRYTAGDDKSITVNARVHQLFSNSTITNNIYRVYASPMEGQSSVTGVKTYLEQDATKTEVKVSRDEVPSMRESVNPSPEATYASEVTVKEHTQHGVFLNPKRGSFENDPRDWSFYRGKSEVITATIKDKDFLRDYQNGKYRLLSTDLLTVDLLERQTVVGTIVKKPTYEILQVTNYIKGPEQGYLSDGSDSPSTHK